MPIVGVEKLVELQQDPECVRNICILAHVDHGKTSLTDSLIATNGIISPKMAGKIRYLDSRPDEQLRGITMEASAISLYFSIQSRAGDETGAKPEESETGPKVSEYLINLIDSPGHVDFQFEVSTASRLCDGAVILVDAVEGVGSQTVAVLRQAWTEKLQTVLVINKMDRLITELKLTPSEAYAHLRKLIEQVNAVVGGFVLGDRIEQDLRWRERVETQRNGGGDAEGAAATEDSEFQEQSDEDVYFSPESNNVIFSSAIDGWAFTIKQFAHIWSRKTGMSKNVLEKTLWGDYYLDSKAKKVLTPKLLKGRKSLKPMFVQLILETIWSIYGIITTEGPLSPEQVEKLRTISPAVTPSLVRSNDRSGLTKAVFSAWLPLSTAVLVTTIQQLPSPKTAQAARIVDLLDEVPGTDQLDRGLRQSMIDFSTGKGAPVVAYVSKMVAVQESELMQNRRRERANLTAEEARQIAREKRAQFAHLQAQAGEGDLDTLVSSIGATSLNEEPALAAEAVEKEDPEHLIGFARLFSGTLSVGDTVYAIPPKYSPADPASPQPKPVTIKQLYLLMGRSMEPIDSVPAGVIVGIEGLEGAIIKSGTLCSTPDGAVNFAGLSSPSKPILRVALEPVNPADLDKLIDGLKLLVQADPCAEFELLDSGEYVICCAGELHLERCLKDLTERYAKCEIQQGEPIVPFRETIVVAPEMNEPADKELGRGRVVAGNPNFLLTLSVKPLPGPITDFLLHHSRALYDLSNGRQDDERRGPNGAEGEADVGATAGVAVDGGVASGDTCSAETVRTRFQKVISELEDPKEAAAWKELLGSGLEKVVTFGPRRTGPNIFVDCTPEQIFPRAFASTENGASGAAQAPSSVPPSYSTRFLADKVSYAFQLALTQGPLCNEPVQGIAVFVERATPVESNPESGAAIPSGRLTSETIRSVRDSIHRAFLDFSPRLLLATFRLEIQATTDVLGRVYAVVTRRQGQVIDEYMQEGASSSSSFFTVIAKVPVVEGFGLVEEIRKRTSGAASAQSVFAGFEILDQDPFWVPKTEEEIEDLGDTADRENVAKRYMDRIRLRKGLLVAGMKLVENAEKQSNLKR